MSSITPSQPEMSPEQALTLATLVVEFEIESAVASHNGPWARELAQAREILSQMINRPHPGQFFMSANERRKKLNDQAGNGPTARAPTK